MTHLPPEFHKFLAKLDKNNNRDWFNAHKEDYIKHIKEPFELFISGLILASQKVDPEILITPKEAMFRIYKDVRFSKNKTPYKTNMSASISKYGRKKMLHPGIFVQVGVNGLWMASGVYRPEPQIRDRIRTYIKENHSEFKKILKAKALKENWGEIQGDKNKVLPAHFKEFLEEEPLIANKAFYISSQIEDPKILTDPKLEEIIIKHFKAAKPLAAFLTKAMQE
jgi:uncharacterized protein (TIGR02453 family)